MADLLLTRDLYECNISIYACQVYVLLGVIFLLSFLA
jgi:hypothetical protein